MIEILPSINSLFAVRPGRSIGRSKFWRIIVCRLDKKFKRIDRYQFLVLLSINVMFPRRNTPINTTDEHIFTRAPHTVYDVIVTSLNDYIYSFLLYSHTLVGPKEEEKEEVITLPG